MRLADPLIFATIFIVRACEAEQPITGPLPPAAALSEDAGPRGEPDADAGADPVLDLDAGAEACDAACLLGQRCNAGQCEDVFAACGLVDGGGGCPEPACTDPGRFSLDASGIVIDVWNGREMWSAKTEAPMTHADAAAFCAGLTLGGVTGWTLPDAAMQAELASLFAFGGNPPHGPFTCPGKCLPIVDQAAFPDTVPEPYWGGDPGWVESMDGGAPYLGFHFTDECSGQNTNAADEGALLHFRCYHAPL